MFQIHQEPQVMPTYDEQDQEEHLISLLAEAQNCQQRYVTALKKLRLLCTTKEQRHIIETALGRDVLPPPKINR